MQFNVYKLTCNTTGLVYYGSTEETIKRRLQSGHKSKYKKYLEGTSKDYCTSYEVLKNNDYKIELLEKCDDKFHMRERETFYFDNFECVNKIRPSIPGRTYKEWLKTFKEELAEKYKKYYERNKQKINEYKKEYYKNNRERILEEQKKYSQDNKEKIAKYQKEWYINNNQKVKEKYTCECGSTLTKGGKARHEKTKKHQDFINKKK